MEMSAQDQRFEVASMGTLYRKSLDLFADHLEDPDGNEIQLDDLKIDQPFFVIFPSGTGFTRTSAKRIA
jgi:hypothetical protein